MFKQKHFIAIGLVLLVVLLILGLPTRGTNRLKLALGSMFLPLFGLTHAAEDFPVNAADAIMPRRELLKEIAVLRTENEQHHVQDLQAAATIRENDQLRALVGWQRQTPWRLKLANVILRDPANWWRTLSIDLGSRDGLHENLPVLTASGLVGRVSSVGLTRSTVILIGDPNCKVSGMVENQARDIGVLSASGPLDDSMVDLSYLSGDANLKAGQNVVTSGMGGIFPPGIPVGQIVDARPVEFGLYTEARVKLSANIGGLEKVWVMFP